ncbi:MAG: hypothetical protein M3Y48_24705 [Actinomycetota bacterium]|nr:hypothetical protein [Actinomycetota bacterium]
MSCSRPARRGTSIALDTPGFRVALARRPGSDFVFRALDIGETTTPGLTQRASGTTINDVLVAALHLTVQSWNTKYGVPTNRIGVQINIRPADRLWDVVSNLTSMVSVSTDPDDPWRSSGRCPD